jgi:N-acetylglucosaminyl-diphospho-decaprenol L-rhamnosyltransferase
VNTTSSVALSVIIVTYNSEQVIKACLESLPTGRDIEILVADNLSSDGTIEVVQALRLPQVRVIQTGANLGFAKAVNLAAKEARGTTLMLFNPDAVLQPGATDVLTDLLHSDVSIGIVAPVIKHPSGRLRTLSGGHFPTIWRMVCHFAGLSRMFEKSRRFEGHYLLPSQLQGTRDVDWVTGACFVIDADLWRAIGGLTEEWFMYAEDIQICWKVKQAGKRVLMTEDAHSEHLIGGSSTGHEASTNPAWVVNLGQFYRRYLARLPLQPFAWRIVVSAGLASRAIIFTVLSARPSSKSAMWRQEGKRFASFAGAVLTKN